MRDKVTEVTELERLQRVEADAAALRRAFNKAAETCPPNWLPADAPRDLRRKIEYAFQAWFGELYRVVTNNEAGLEILGEIARLRAASPRQWLVLIDGKISQRHDSLAEANRHAEGLVLASEMARPTGGWAGTVEVVGSVARWEPDVMGRVTPVLPAGNVDESNSGKAAKP